MTFKAVLLGIVAGYGILDTRLLGISMSDRPLVMCTLSGIILGDVQAGLKIGASLELIFLGVVNIGAAPPPNIITGSVLATSFAIISGKGPETALALAMPISILAQQIGIGIRILNASIVEKAEKTVKKTGNLKAIGFYHLVPTTILFFLSGFLPVFLGVAFGTDIVKNILNSIPEVILSGLTTAGHIMPAFGFAMLLSMMISKKLTPFFLLGFLMSAYANLSIIPVALFGCVLAFIINQLIDQMDKKMDEGKEVI
ncbi:PTS sugar transporter subunit IIC [Sporohalobacter salinus]|uniref:PTS sugar transporter subunit IIC n=1 Tax=Sporohalobacter salinus TaxID=1494606 RepID=UPI0019603576|nr:PTS system mannose-specific IIC component [Sporohalobacter salinus]